MDLGHERRVGIPADRIGARLLFQFGRLMSPMVWLAQMNNVVALMEELGLLGAYKSGRRRTRQMTARDEPARCEQ